MKFDQQSVTYETVNRLMLYSERTPSISLKILSALCATGNHLKARLTIFTLKHVEIYRPDMSIKELFVTWSVQMSVITQNERFFSGS